MATATKTSSTEDGYIRDFGGLTVNKTTPTNQASTSSSSNTEQYQAFFFFPIDFAALGIPAGSVINSVTLRIWCFFQTDNMVEQWNLYATKNGLGTTLGTEDWNQPGGTPFATVSSGGWTTGAFNTFATVPPSVIEDGATVGIAITCTAGDTPGGQAIFECQERFSNNPAELVIDYTAPSGAPLRTLMGVGT